MKKHIVRVPQTDRYLLSVPESLTDLDDYEEVFRSVIGEVTQASSLSGGPLTIAAGPMTPVQFDTVVTETELTYEQALGRFVIEHAGLYLVSAQLNWPGAVSGPSAGPAPQAAYRFCELVTGSGTREVLTSANAYDTISTFLQLSVGDSVWVEASWNDPTQGVNGTVGGTFKILKLTT